MKHLLVTLLVVGLLLSRSNAYAQTAGVRIFLLDRNGATLSSTLDVTTPKLDQPVTLSASLSNNGAPVTLDSAEAILHLPDGLTTLPMQISGNTATLSFTPKATGIHGVEINVTAHAQDGTTIDRAAFLTFEAEPAESLITTNRLIAVGGVVALCGLGVVFLMIMIVWRRKTKPVRG